MLAAGWSVFGEYNYMDFGHRNLAFAASPVLSSQIPYHPT
jgi:outer membrane immunogenic protein